MGRRAERRDGRAHDLARRMTSALLAIVLAFGLLPAPQAALADVADSLAEDSVEVVAMAYDEGEIIIIYEDDALEDDDEALVEAGVVEQEEIATTSDGEGTIVVATLEEGVSVEEAIEQLADDESVASVQPNYTYELLSTTTDDPYNVEDDSSVYNQYYLYASGFVDAWDYVKVEGTVTIAVVDTGCNLEHEELAGTVDTEHAYDATTGTLLADSDVANNGDANGHGTQVCGIIAAVANNGMGIAGASYNATVLPVKVFDSNGTCTTADVVAAYAYLAALIDAGEVTNLRVINMSIGTYTSGTSPSDLAMEQAINELLEEYGVITVCAGGNGIDNEAQTVACYPADFDACVSVTALAADGSNATYSDYNAYKDISAYGEKILTISASGGYASTTGTSMASPQVAAAIALIWAANPDLSASQVVSILQQTATEVTGNAHEESGSAGAIDVEAAVLLALSTDGSSDDEAEDGGTSTSTSSSSAVDSITDGSVVVSYGFFVDVQDATVYWYTPVYTVAALGYMTGKTSTYFGATDALTRAQMVTILWRIACPDEYAAYTASVQAATKNATGMDDVADGMYYTAAVNWAVAEGIVEGKVASDGTRYFDPGGACTFQQFCTILARYLAGGDDALEAAVSSSQAASVLSAFSDGDEVAGYASKAVAYCVSVGAVDGKANGTLAPAETIVRGRAATVLYKAIRAGLL